MICSTACSVACISTQLKDYFTLEFFGLKLLAVAVLSERKTNSKWVPSFEMQFNKIQLSKTDPFTSPNIYLFLKDISGITSIYFEILSK